LALLILPQTAEKQNILGSQKIDYILSKSSMDSAVPICYSLNLGYPCCPKKTLAARDGGSKRYFHILPRPALPASAIVGAQPYVLEPRLEILDGQNERVQHGL
jgi:hypothetical protein